MKNLVRRIQGKAVPKEVVCRPQVWQMRVWFRGDANPLSYRLVGEENIKKARDFIDAITAPSGSDWWISENMRLRCADVSLVRFERIE